MECCNRLFRCNQTCYCAGMVSIKVDPLCTAAVDSTELTDMRVDWGTSQCAGELPVCE